MPRPIESRSLLSQILVGEQSGGGAQSATRPRHAAGLLAGEDGMLSFVTVIVLLGFVVLIGFVGNVGQSVTAKIKLQNATDAAAYSSSLWLARGMNAVTATNHLMGEATAIMVILESFGGPVLREGESVDTDKNGELHDAIEDLRPVERDKIVPFASNWSGSIIEAVDGVILPPITDRFVADDGALQSGAAIYDAEITLKQLMVAGLLVKNICADVIQYTFWIPFGIGPLIEGICFGIHQSMTPIIGKVGQEWIWLEAVETGVGLVWTNATKQSMTEALIPALSIYGDTVAGRLGNANGQTRTAMNDAIEGTLEMLEQAHDAQLRIFPDGEDLRLPIDREQPPTAEGAGGDADLGEWESPPSLWVTRGRSKNPAVNFIRDAFGEFAELAETIEEWTGWLDDLDFLDLGDSLSNLNKAMGSLGGPGNYMSIAQDALEDLGKLARGAIPPTRPHNPCLDEQFEGGEYTIDPFYWEEERKSQWARATYPYVDSYRAPITEFFSDWCTLSMAADYYTHWTHRYTLATSVEIRGDGSPHMYVLRDMEPDAKGHERWTEQDPLRAEEYFTMLASGIVTRTEPAFSPSLFGNPKQHDIVTFSQAMIYNANGRKVSRQGQPTATQANTGWDTLNWTPPVQAWEWGDHVPSDGGSDPWDAFTQDHDPNPRAHVRLNWQAKLVPLTDSRLGDLAASDQEANIEERVDLLLKHPQLEKH